MTRRRSSLWLCLAATILVSLSLVLGAQAKAAMPFSGPLMAVEICHDDSATIIWLDAGGNEHPAPQDCRDCCPCALPPPALPPAAALAPLHATLTAATHPNRGPGMTARDRQVPSARGPPPFQSRTASA